MYAANINKYINDGSLVHAAEVNTTIVYASCLDTSNIPKDVMLPLGLSISLRWAGVVYGMSSSTHRHLNTFYARKSQLPGPTNKIHK